MDELTEERPKQVSRGEFGELAAQWRARSTRAEWQDGAASINGFRANVRWPGAFRASGGDYSQPGTSAAKRPIVIREITSSPPSGFRGRQAVALV
jgi:hypothetical protein